MLKTTENTILHRRTYIQYKMYIYVYIYKAIMRLLHQTFYVIKDLIIIIIKRWIIFPFDIYTILCDMKFEKGAIL